MDSIDTANLIDIKLDRSWQFTADATGDFLQTTGRWECLLQEIQLEALTQEGDLFYDEGFGWSLMDFLHIEADELTELEVRQRVLDKLSWYEEVDINTIAVQLTAGEAAWQIGVRFRFVGDAEMHEIQLALDRINAEVVIA